ncbi:hypothetical protein FB567DRAFT_204200 [Paraphoma chrysanthemicola]|uniref:Uncharacterized protein n=1 Tax=Paraphoma chrysanthemicola TaxID=798071 RepID=A0A8K0QX07_9PLEO|nr:hypothetical protein FB567DRAFT_204200 [Paraphoma chrysanthemicola]
MASWTNSFGYEPAKPDAEIDTIDLTLSSPEPELQPRGTSQQQRFPINFKREPRSDTGNGTRKDAERRATEMKAQRSRKHPRRVDPQHLAQIVNTSNSTAVRSVLLELCKLSPALSGAVARGLAPHSTFAQNVIKKHRQNATSGSNRIAKQEESDDQSAYERMKRRLAAEKSARVSTLNSAHVSPNVANQYKVSSAASQSVPRIKREYHREATESDSDLDSYIPGSFPITPQRNQTEVLPLRGPSRISATRTTQPYSFQEQFSHAQQSSSIKREAEVKICTQCHERIEEGMEICFYHPGPEVTDGRDLTCYECTGPMSDLGCRMGTHSTD